MSRYKIVHLADRQGPTYKKWVILDREMGGYCTLPDDPKAERPNLLPLEWRTRQGAEAWLHKCYMNWDRNTVPAPRNWRPHEGASPWSYAVNTFAPFGLNPPPGNNLR